MSSLSPPPKGKARSPLTGKAFQPSPRPDKPGRQRRTQAERLAATRAGIIAATVTYIDERGFHQASLQRVAKAAGVTVGAVQHHFSSKTELLTAVVEDNFQQLTRTLQQAAFEGAPLAQRIALFVDQSWEFCNSSRYQASLQILLGIRNASDQKTGSSFEHWVNQTLGHVVSEGFDLWLQVFRDIPLSEAEHFDILLYLFSSLSGSALLARISRVQERVDSDLGELKKLLQLRFSEAQSPTARSAP